MKLFRLPAKYEDFREGKKKEMTKRRRRKKKEERRKKKEEKRKKNHNNINETSTDRNTQEKRLSAGQEKVG